MADGGVSLVLSPEPFSRAVAYAEVPEGSTVRAALAVAVEAGQIDIADLVRTCIYIDGLRLDRNVALDHVLAEGQIVNIIVEPLGGGGGGGKDVGQILLTVAVIAVSLWVGGGAATPAGFFDKLLVRQVMAAGVMAGGQVAIAALFKPQNNMARVNDRYALSSASNQYRPWAPMPLALGEVVVAPDLAVKTFTQAQGEDQWIYGILGLHRGPCAVSELKIGDTLVSSMGANDVRVALHLTPGPRNFSIVANKTIQLDLQEQLQATVGGSTPVVRTASSEGERFEFDFFMPQGLYFAKDDGRKIAASITLTVRYRPVDQSGNPTGSGAWSVGLTAPKTSSSSDPWRFMHTLALPLGRYEFEVSRSRLEDDNAKRKTDVAWTAVRAIAFQKPVADESLSLIEFAVRASALNQGALAAITCRITPICETWTGSEWGPPVPTSNPAAVTRWLMTGPAPAVPLTPAQADVGLRTWAALCDQYNWKAHLYLTDDRKQDVILQMLGVIGRAGLFWDGTQLVASPWVEKPVPRQLFAGSNLKDHSWNIVYPDEVHALRVEFQNLDQGGEADEVYVYADGYGEKADPSKGIKTATLIEAHRLEGQQTMDRAYRDGRWTLGARVHQRRVDSWSTDLEHVVCRLGDRVRLAWDRVGSANATVRNRLWSGDKVAGLRLSQPVRMEPGKNYAVDLRLPGSVIAGVPIVNQATIAPVDTRLISFADLRDVNSSPRGGDLVAFGEPQRVSEDVEIIGITPGPDMTASLVGIRYVAPILMAGETGPIPPLESRLSRDRAMDPPMPTLLGWQADAEGVRVSFSMPPWRGSPITGFTVRWRQTPLAGQTSPWLPLPDLAGNAMTVVAPPLRELPAESTNVTSAQVQIVATTADGRVSPPLQVTVQEAAVQQPPAGDWSVTPMTAGPDGSRQSGFLVLGTVGSLNARRVTVEFGAANDGPWTSAFDGPPVDGVVRASILGMQPGTTCFIAITYWTAQAAAPSIRRVFGPYVVPTLVASDVLPNAPGLSQIKADIAAAFGDIFDVSTLIGQTRSDLEAADRALAGSIDRVAGDLDQAASQLSSAIGAVGNRAETLELKTASLQTDKASVVSLAAQVARIDNVEGVNATQALALVDLELGKVSLSEYGTLKAEVVAGRDGAQSLLAKIENLKAVDLDLEQKKASVQVVSALGVRTEGVEAGITDLRRITTDLEGGKASAEALNAQRLRIDSAEAVNATQALSLIDLENSKVSLSQYDTLRGEVIAAREGQPSLLGQIQNLKSVDLDLEQKKASVDSVNALAARTANTEADIIDLGNAVAAETGARAQAISQIAARQNVRENKIANSTGALGYEGWPGTYGARPPEAYPNSGASPTFGLSFDSGASGLTGGRYQTVRFNIEANVPYSFQAELSAYLITAGSVRAYVTYEDAAGNSLTTHGVSASVSSGYVRLTSENFVTPTGTVRGVVNIDYSGASFSPGGYAGWRRLKLEPGPVCTTWSDDASTRALSASVTEQSLAIIDLENQQAIAAWRVKAEAAGGRPAIIEAVSSTLGRYIAFGAEQIYFGDNTVFDDATDTLQTVVGLNVRVLAFGAPFGADSNLLEWWGPASIALGAMKPVNGYEGRLSVAPYRFDNVSVGNFAAVSDVSVADGARATAGLVITREIIVAVTGNGGAVKHEWSQLSGDATWSISSPSSASTTFKATVTTPFELKRATFIDRVTDLVTGRVTAVTVGGSAAYVPQDTEGGGT